MSSTLRGARGTNAESRGNLRDKSEYPSKTCRF